MAGKRITLAAKASGAPQTLVNEFAVAIMLAVSVKTVRRWRLLGIGPKFRRLSRRCVRYCVLDVEAYLDSLETGGGQ